jgi:DnaK suppressor protein
MSESEPPVDEAHARERLRQERERIEGALARLERGRQSDTEEIDTSTDPVDDAGLIEEGQVDEAVAVQLRVELEAIARAESRLEDGTYGLSIESGEPIPAQRLETIPWAERTPEEQERYERTHGRAL